MQKRIVHVLIVLMAISLIGIIIVQYRWIERAIDEKQLIIDNNVYSTVAKVEEQLNDRRSMAFVMDTLIHKYHSDQNVWVGQNLRDEPFIDEFGDLEETNVIQVHVSQNSDTAEFKGGWDYVEEHIIRKAEVELEDTVILKFKDAINGIEAFVSKMNVELRTNREDSRLDSAHVRELLVQELNANGLDELNNWSIWDKKEEDFVIRPQNGKTVDYSIPLFTTDLLHPGRYYLRLSLKQSNFIWSEIWQMVLLSLVFILIISLVFAYSIKLVVKHRKISQIKSDFINNMTHEFKTPLASISLAADSLIHPNTTLNFESAQKYVGIIQAEKNKLNQQVERILEVASLRKDSLDIPVKIIHLKEVIESALEKFNLQIEQGMIDLSSKINDRLRVRANTFHLENVLVNLIENGIKYSEDKPKIAINADTTDGTILISDHGIGMTSKQLDKVFDNFYRVQSGDLHQTKGFGLGLSYCKLVIEKMKGEISLRSEVGQGTTATIKLETA